MDVYQPRSRVGRFVLDGNHALCVQPSHGHRIGLEIISISSGLSIHWFSPSIWIPSVRTPKDPGLSQRSFMHSLHSLRCWASTIRSEDRKEQQQIRHVNRSVQIDITGALGQRDTLPFRFIPLRSRSTVKRWIDLIIITYSIIIRV